MPIILFSFKEPKSCHDSGARSHQMYCQIGRLFIKVRYPKDKSVRPKTFSPKCSEHGWSFFNMPYKQNAHTNGEYSGAGEVLPEWTNLMRAGHGRGSELWCEDRS